MNASRTMAMASLEAKLDNAGLPVRRTDMTNAFDIAAGWSHEVLVKINGWEGLHLGRYAHGCEEWRIGWINGAPEVIEWWPLPKEGTGVAVLK